VTVQRKAHYASQWSRERPTTRLAQFGIAITTAPDFAEPVIGRSFAPTRWLDPGYSPDRKRRRFRELTFHSVL
jgi:hypothetical protein